MGNHQAKTNSKRRILLVGRTQTGKNSLLAKLRDRDQASTHVKGGFEDDISTIHVSDWSPPFGRCGPHPYMDLRYITAPVIGVVYVIDSTHKEGVEECLWDIIEHLLLERQPKPAVIMILANKQDLEGAMSPEDIEKALLDMFKFPENNKQTVFVLPCSAVTSEGVFESFNFFARQLGLKGAGEAEPGLIPFAKSKQMLAKMAEEQTAEKAQEQLAGKKKAFKIKEVVKNPIRTLKFLW